MNTSSKPFARISDPPVSQLERLGASIVRSQLFHAAISNGGKNNLTYSYIGMYCWPMARAATTSDAFNAVAEPRRREILNYLALQERSVGEIVATLELEQPSVSKHLRVLLDVGLVNVRREGRRMMYRVNAEAIRPLHEWTSTFERFWQHQLNRVKAQAERKSSS
jgi:DNA-binding transcriptional ArsR family regulator